MLHGARPGHLQPARHPGASGGVDERPAGENRPAVGVFCAQPAMELLGAPNGAVRASLYLYNTTAEIQTFRDTLDKIAKLA
jgi:hypothetical protein